MMVLCGVRALGRGGAGWWGRCLVDFDTLLVVHGVLAEHLHVRLAVRVDHLDAALLATQYYACINTQLCLGLAFLEEKSRNYPLFLN